MNRSWSRLYSLALILVLPALACTISSSGPGPQPPGQPPAATRALPPAVTAAPPPATSAPVPAFGLWETTLSDAKGWNNSPYWNTIQYADVNHDGQADICGRGIAGVYCGLSNGTGFSPVTLWEGNFSDANGWNNQPYWNTIQYADVNGDGLTDVCGRGIAGVYCGLSNGSTFPAQ